MDVQTLITGAVLALAATYFIRTLYRMVSGHACCGCSGEKKCEKKSSKKQ